MNLFELCTIFGDQIHIEVFQAKRDSDTANWPDLVDLWIFRGQKESDVIYCVAISRRDRDEDSQLGGIRGKNSGGMRDCKSLFWTLMYDNTEKVILILVQHST